MVRGLYAAASGALAAQSQADNVANNLANVNSSGFKQTLLQIESAPTLDIYRIQTDPGHTSGRALPGVPVAVPVGPLGTGSQIYDTPEDFAQGPLQQTGNRLDLALTGANQFFTIATPNGVRYTRDGQFTLDANGTLRTLDGNPVLSTTGRPIVFNTQQGTATFNSDGTVTQAPQAGQAAAAATQLGTLQLASFGNLLALRKEGDNNFVDTGNAQPGATQNVSVQQGFLEKSNGNVVRAMVDLITAERWFDANQRVMKAEDDATSQDITYVAKPNS
ncbi:MAG TPA: flagellar hook-basal body complex protein [Candidatus Baltobacteraceae bacterium]|nr:flagellar hook-basal body complex protein [Candidatus Baltobacteraceae bacterium]